MTTLCHSFAHTMVTNILTLDRHADDQEGLWSRGEAAQYTHEILQSVRDPSLLVPQGVSLSIIFRLV